LAAHIGDKHVLGLYHCFLDDMKKTLTKQIVKKMLFYTPNESTVAAYFQDSFDADVELYPQKGGDLGDRMKNAFSLGFNSGYEKLVLIGSDTPHLSENFLQGALEALTNHDCVLGPSPDGGYYLIGFRKEMFLEEAFCRIVWSTERVLDQTILALEREVRSFALLPELRDVDDFYGLQQFYTVASPALRTFQYITQHNLL
jgi:uncharacterized protein